MKSLTIIVWGSMYALSFSKVSFMNVGALALEHRCSELRFHLGRFFSLWPLRSVLPYLLGQLLFESLFYPLYKWLLYLLSWNHLLGKFFSNLWLWGLPQTVFVTDVGILYAAKCWVLFTYPVCLSIFFYCRIESTDIKRY